MKVVVRLKPVDSSIVSVLDTTLVLDPTQAAPDGATCNNRRVKQHQFVMDSILSQDCSQEEVYDKTTYEMLQSLIEGHNSTIFAYGATGCGKTHTITGSIENPGIIYRAINQLFDYISGSEKVTEISLSYLEIYNEQIRDLLQPKTPSSKLNLLEVNNESIKIANLTKVTPMSIEEIYDLIIRANSNRTVSPTQANSASSRSHSILQINLLQSTNSGLQDEILQSTLNIIDLAGSERASSTFNQGKTLHEGANINKSLLALGSCISSLSENKTHVPFRNSKLTRLLKYSLGGNCKTCMIVCISPDLIHFDDSLNALKYANMAKNIKTSSSIKKNFIPKHVGDYEKTIMDQQRIIENYQFQNDAIIKKSLENYQNDLMDIILKIDSIGKSIEMSILQNNLSEKYLETQSVNTFIQILSKYDLDSKFDTLINSMNSFLDQRSNDLPHFINQSFENHLLELKSLNGWTQFHQNYYNLLFENLSLKYTPQPPKDDADVSKILAKLMVDIDSLLEIDTNTNDTTTGTNLKMSIYGIMDKLSGEIISTLSSTGFSVPSLSLNIRKRRQSGDNSEDEGSAIVSTPKKRIASLNNHMMNFQLDSSMDQSLESPNVSHLGETQQQMQPQAQKSFNMNLTSKKLNASPKIHSPNRLAGLSFTYQTKMDSLDIAKVDKKQDDSAQQEAQAEDKENILSGIN